MALVTVADICGLLGPEGVRVAAGGARLDREVTWPGPAPGGAPRGGRPGRRPRSAGPPPRRPPRRPPRPQRPAARGGVALSARGGGGGGGGGAGRHGPKFSIQNSAFRIESSDPRPPAPDP